MLRSFAIRWPLALAGSVLALCLGLFVSGTASAQPGAPLPSGPCGTLQQADFSTIPGAPASIMSTQIISATDTQPEYCEVYGLISSQIQFKLWLPTAGWNERYLQVGCGGYCGSTDPSEQCYTGLAENFAVGLEQLRPSRRRTGRRRRRAVGVRQHGAARGLRLPLRTCDGAGSEGSRCSILRPGPRVRLLLRLLQRRAPGAAGGAALAGGLRRHHRRRAGCHPGAAQRRVRTVERAGQHRRRRQPDPATGAIPTAATMPRWPTATQPTAWWISRSPTRGAATSTPVCSSARKARRRRPAIWARCRR